MTSSWIASYNVTVFNYVLQNTSPKRCSLKGKLGGETHQSDVAYMFSLTNSIFFKMSHSKESCFISILQT